jgi:hypothetical protein
VELGELFSRISFKITGESSKVISSVGSGLSVVSNEDRNGLKR